MLSYKQCRRIDPRLKDLTDEEIREVLSRLYDIAELAMNDWFKKKGGSKNPTAVVRINKL